MPPKRKNRSASVTDVTDLAGEPDELTKRLKAEVTKDASAAADAETELVARAIRNPVSPPGSRTDNKFYARFIRMGQGDCIALKTPGGKMILVDCGTIDPDGMSSANRLAFAYDSLFIDRFLKQDQHIDILILTHPDKDHINKLREVLTYGGQTITIGSFYHSFDLTKYQAGPRNFVTQVLQDDAREYRVVHNEDPKVPESEVSLDYRLPTASKYERNRLTTASTDPKEVNCLDGQGGIRIVAETGGVGCTVTLLAGTVVENYDSDNDPGNNRGSVVTLVKVGDKVLLLCGDATRSTEKYLYEKGKYAKQIKPRLEKVHVVQVGHHGSARTSSGEEFLELVNPRERAVISAGKTGRKEHHLPSKEVVELYQEQFGTPPARTADAHPISCWWPGDDAAPKDFAVSVPIYATGSDISATSDESHLDITWPA
ncbi:ComEC/Rec2 family competence protein [Plantactinospora sp. WMMC1484]|uniref:ComEC/Rec2 family competence protein n=1 Tax=Plantactinospora sp. WMMC1484 TaxID=3404122 RepID=UPI003BF4BED7